jgi:AcrR family transcriptional regulator
MTMISSPHPVTGEPTSFRAQAKLKTRVRVLEAARRLFVARGYELSTVRDIAAEAGLSTGAVFAGFTDKADLFNAVMAEDLQRLTEGLRDGERPGAPVDEAVLAVFEVGYRFHLAQLPLLRAAIGLSWSQGLGGEWPSSGPAMDVLKRALGRGVERGELNAETDPQLVAECLWDTYIANYRRALFDSWTEAQLVERSRGQIALILKGYRAV